MNQLVMSTRNPLAHGIGKHMANHGFAQFLFPAKQVLLEVHRVGDGNPLDIRRGISRPSLKNLLDRHGISFDYIDSPLTIAIEIFKGNAEGIDPFVTTRARLIRHMDFQLLLDGK